MRKTNLYFHTFTPMKINDDLQKIDYLRWVRNSHWTVVAQRMNSVSFKLKNLHRLALFQLAVLSSAYSDRSWIAPWGDRVWIVRVDRLSAPVLMAISHLTIFTIFIILMLTTILANWVVRLDWGERLKRIEAGAVGFGSVASARLGLLEATKIERKPFFSLQLFEPISFHL